MTIPPLFTLLLMSLVAVAVGMLGAWMTGVPKLARKIVPFSGGVLAGMALFWVLPELAEHFGWASGAGWLVAGVAGLWAINRFVYPVCPTCSHTHDHASCGTRLHGFATPLITAAAIHSFLDGWGVAVSQEASTGELGRAIFLGIALHKVPEGVALGVILRASLGTWAGAVAGCAGAQLPMLAAGLMERLVAPHMDAHWMFALLAVAGGSFLFLGLHAVHGEWKRGGVQAAFVTAFAGAAGAAVLQHGVKALLR